MPIEATKMVISSPGGVGVYVARKVHHPGGRRCIWPCHRRAKWRISRNRNIRNGGVSRAVAGGLCIGGVASAMPYQAVAKLGAHAEAKSNEGEVPRRSEWAAKEMVRMRLVLRRRMKAARGEIAGPWRARSAWGSAPAINGEDHDGGPVWLLPCLSSR